LAAAGKVGRREPLRRNLAPVGYGIKRQARNYGSRCPVRVESVPTLVYVGDPGRPAFRSTVRSRGATLG